MSKKDKLRRPIVIFSDMDGCISPKRKVWYMDREFEITQGHSYDYDVPMPEVGSYSHTHLNVMKPICDHDSGTISLIRQLKQIELVFISGDDRINKAYAERQSIPFIFTGQVKHSDKWEFLKSYWKRVYGGSPEGKYVYVGDSIPDYRCLINSGLGFIPRDSSLLLATALDETKPEHVKVLDSCGGDGVLEETLVRLIQMGKIQKHSILKRLGVK